MNSALAIEDLKTGKKTVAEGNLLASMAAVEQKPNAMPAGYIPIRLSTQGRVGAPALFHVRNFNTRDIMGLALTDDDELPGRVVELLNDLIYEDVDVESFHENEVVETLVLIYKAFFTPVLKEREFPWNTDDLKALEELYPGSFIEKKAALESGAWKPKVDIDIQDGVDTYDLDDSFHPVATIKHKDSEFSCSFGLPRYGDVLVLKRWLTENYNEREKAFAADVQMLKLRETMLQRFESGESVDLSRLPVVDSAREAAYNKLQIEKATALVDVIRGLHLCAFDGKDVTELPLSERIALVQDPRVDVSVAKKLDDYFNSLKFGIKPEVRMLNPITNQPCTRRFSFRLVDILQAVQVSAADQYDIVFDSKYGL